MGVNRLRRTAGWEWIPRNPLQLRRGGADQGTPKGERELGAGPGNEQSTEAEGVEFHKGGNTSSDKWKRQEDQKNPQKM